MIGEDLDTELVAATLTVQETDLTWPPPAVQPVDPSEVPEVEAFFFARRAAAMKIAAFFLGALIVTMVGIATATAEEQLVPITRDAASSE